MKKIICSLLSLAFVFGLTSTGFSFTFMGGNAFSSNAEITDFRADKNSGELSVDARVCPPLFFGSWVSGSDIKPKLRQLIAGKIQKWQSQNPNYSVKRAGSLSTSHETSMLRKAKDGNRCTTASADYLITPKADIASRGKATTSRTKILKVAVRNGFPMDQQKEGSAWSGASIIFAEAVGRKLGSKVQFVEMTNVGKCLKGVKYGMADLSISLISNTPERAQKYKVSNPYFKTGIVAATLNLPTLKEANNSGFNSANFTAIVAENTTAHTFVKNTFPSMKLITVKMTPDVYKKAVQLEEEQSEGGRSGVIIFTDEVIASTWSGVFVISHNPDRLYTQDEYVAVARTEKIRTAVNQVIKDENIEEMYLDLVGR